MDEWMNGWTDGWINGWSDPQQASSGQLRLEINALLSRSGKGRCHTLVRRAAMKQNAMDVLHMGKLTSRGYTLLRAFSHLIPLGISQNHTGGRTRGQGPMLTYKSPLPSSFEAPTHCRGSTHGQSSCRYATCAGHV